MTDVSFLRFLNISDPCIQGELISLVHELELEESRAYGVRALESEQPCRQSRGGFAADIALASRYSTPIFRPHYKPDLSAFVPFYQQLSLFSD